ncbi:hypothetical protein CSUB01_12462 [Colletotrichum sublineola]|uniref:Uncharacterized protein n=1 Tax=Colletotrichum sublineola TaxID=1173701 RepID=A0A066XLL3_COLSU|nr:hypothetical protein CSUB01_12462 [Colletotrichum sublineola]
MISNEDVEAADQRLEELRPALAGSVQHVPAARGPGRGFICINVQLDDPGRSRQYVVSAATPFPGDALSGAWGVLGRLWQRRRLLGRGRTWRPAGCRSLSALQQKRHIALHYWTLRLRSPLAGTCLPRSRNVPPPDVHVPLRFGPSFSIGKAESGSRGTSEWNRDWLPAAPPAQSDDGAMWPASLAVATPYLRNPDTTMASRVVQHRRE